MVFEVKIRRERWGSQATSPAAMESIHEGDNEEDVLKRAGQPIDDSMDNRRRRKKLPGGNVPMRTTSPCAGT